jgi:hypothetical protein
MNNRPSGFVRAGFSVIIMTNEERAQRIGRAILTEYDDGGSVEIVDVLADLMHLCERFDVDFEKVICTAYGHYLAESKEEGCEVPPLLGVMEKENANLCEWCFQLEHSLEQMREELNAVNRSEADS